MNLSKNIRLAVTAVAPALLMFGMSGSACAAPAADNPADWPEYDRDYRGWRFSPLEQVNKSNVKKLKVAWIHQPGDIT